VARYRAVEVADAPTDPQAAASDRTAVFPAAVAAAVAAAVVATVAAADDAADDAADAVAGSHLRRAFPSTVGTGERWRR